MYVVMSEMSSYEGYNIPICAVSCALRYFSRESRSLGFSHVTLLTYGERMLNVEGTVSAGVSAVVARVSLVALLSFRPDGAMGVSSDMSFLAPKVAKTWVSDANPL